MDITLLTAIDILAIPLERPDKLFKQDDVVGQYRAFVSKWHPDRNGDSELSNKVFCHLKELKEKALEQIGENTWKGAGIVMFLSEEKKLFKIHYSIMHEFELGKMYIGHTKIIYVIDKQHEELFHNALIKIKTIHYPNSKFKEEFPKFMPAVHKILWHTSIGHVLVLDKTKDVVLLKDLLEFLPDKKIPPKHVAWMCNSVLNSMCFLNHIELNLNGISSSTIFISPQYHSTCLFGGWWYATKTNSKLVALPTDVLNVLTSKNLMKDKISTSENNLIALRALALECLGDRTKTGSMLLKDPTVPKEFLNWLRSPPAETPIKDYLLLEDALFQAYGKRTFVNFDIDVTKIY